MSVSTFTKSGTKATTPVVLDKNVFGLEVKSHDLLKQAYTAYLANGRENLAVTLKRGEVRGGGKKPWKQKGTGRARFGSSRVPIWRGGGITFGPTGNENYTHKLPTKTKRTAIRQALSMAAAENKISVIEDFTATSGKTKEFQSLLNKLGISRQVLIVVDTKEDSIVRATRNLGEVKLVSAKYLNTYDVINARTILISKKALPIITEWLGESAKTETKEAK